jgi:hypothetical protein
MCGAGKFDSNCRAPNHYVVLLEADDAKPGIFKEALESVYAVNDREQALELVAGVFEQLTCWGRKIIDCIAAFDNISFRPVLSSYAA